MQKLFFLILSSWILTFPVFANGIGGKFETFVATQLKLRKKYYEQTKNISLQIARDCPYDKCFIVTLGRSPTPVIAFLEAIGLPNINQLPLSEFRFNPEGSKLISREDFLEKWFLNDIEKDLEYKHKLDEHLEEKLFRHFQNFLDHNNVGDRKIVLIDFSNQSILSAKKYFELFIIKRNRKNSITAIQYSAPYHQQSVEKVQELYRSSATNIVIEDWAYNNKFAVEYFDSYAKYSSFNIGKDELPDLDGKGSDKFRYLKKIMMYYQDRDEDLKRKLMDIDHFRCQKILQSMF